MFYFMCFMTFICTFNLILMGFFVYKFAIVVLSKDEEEPSKEHPLNRSQ